MNELALFAGAGGGILGGKLLGWRTVCAVELDEHARASLMARQNDGCLAPFPIWSDIRSFSARNNATRSAIRRLRRGGNRLVISGGFPCQDVSVAGGGDGLEGVRSGLWKEMRRVIGEIRPRFVFIENSPALTTRGGVRVIAELTALGYDCRWGVVSAADAIWLAGAPCLDHLRERIWIACTRADSDSGRREKQWLQELGGIEGARGGFAHGLRKVREQHDAAADGDADGARWEGRPLGGVCGKEGESLLGQGCDEGADPKGGGFAMRGRAPGSERHALRADLPAEENPDANGSGFEQQRRTVADGSKHEAAERRGWWAAKPGVGRMVDGMANRVDRLKCTGNGQVPGVVRLAWETLTNFTPL